MLGENYLGEITDFGRQMSVLNISHMTHANQM